MKKFIAVVLALFVLIIGGKALAKSYAFPYEHKEYVDKYSSEYDLNPLLVLSIMKTESKFKPEARSNKNAVGLMQITESTGEWIASQMKIENYTKESLYDEETNIKMGCWYLRNLKDEFGTWDEAIAAYNGGRGNVNKWLKDENYSKDGKTLDYIPFGETKKYVDKVNTNYSIYKFLYE
ncbi:MAG: lytic transglycosylase domain-containing protein [Clostridium sp.]